MADDSLTLPPGLQPGPSPEPSMPEPMVDEMGVTNPTVDISEYIKYRYYKCEQCGKKEFAGAMDLDEVVDCVCTTGPTDPKTKKAPHGKMNLLVYASRRDGKPMTKNDHAKAMAQK